MVKLIPCWSYQMPVPEVCVEIGRGCDSLCFCFDVKEEPSCFRQVCCRDGDPCWQDSCVEVFIQSPELGGYFNFETNSAGVTLAEFGTERENRRRFHADEYSVLNRTVWLSPVVMEDGRIHWTVGIEIPLKLLHLKPDDEVYGNLYKCASKADRPVYLVLFPIETEVPDYHRPEFFGRLL